MSIVKIEQLTFRDVEQVVALERENFSRPYTQQDFIEALHNPRKTYYIATIDGTVVGMCGVDVICNEGMLTNVCVKDAYRKEHIATMLLQELMRLGELAGVEAYTLEVRASNQAAIGLYGNCGFVEEGRRKCFYEAPVEDALIMWKRKAT